MKTYDINEIFLSIQGEGAMVGTPAVFVRFAHCNLQCAFCDTDRSVAATLSAEALVEEINLQSKPLQNSRGVLPWVVFTGGEPLLQLDAALLNLVHEAGYLTALETNGQHKGIEGSLHVILSMLYHIAVSPKTSQYSEVVIRKADCVKVLVPFPGDLDEAALDKIDELTSVACHRILQPVTPTNGPHGTEWKTNCEMAGWMAYKRHRQGHVWHVLPQTHLMLGYR